jgi:hypothetical protein
LRIVYEEETEIFFVEGSVPRIFGQRGLIARIKVEQIECGGGLLNLFAAANVIKSRVAFNDDKAIK